MKWNKINSDVEIPWHKVLVYDGANTAFGYLQEIKISKQHIIHTWVIVPDYDGINKFQVRRWSEIDNPKST